MARHWWPQHPPYPFPWKDLAVWSVLCTDKRPHRHMSQINIKVFLHCWINQVLYKWSWTGFARCSDGFSPTASTFHKRHFKHGQFLLYGWQESIWIFWNRLEVFIIEFIYDILFKFSDEVESLHISTPSMVSSCSHTNESLFFSLYRLLSFKNACIQKNIFLLYWLESIVVM